MKNKAKSYFEFQYQQNIGVGLNFGSNGISFRLPNNKIIKNISCHCSIRDIVTTKQNFAGFGIEMGIGDGEFIRYMQNVEAVDIAAGIANLDGGILRFASTTGSLQQNFNDCLQIRNNTVPGTYSVSLTIDAYTLQTTINSNLILVWLLIEFEEYEKNY